MRARTLFALVIAFAGTARGDTKVRPAGDDIFRRGGNAEVPATAPEITAALGAETWMYLNPRKMTSTWESRTYAFHADGTVEVTTNHVGGPATDTVAWKVAAAGKRPAITIASARYRIVACSRGEIATLCLVR